MLNNGLNFGPNIAFESIRRMTRKFGQTPTVPKGAGHLKARLDPVRLAELPPHAAEGAPARKEEGV